MMKSKDIKKGSIIEITKVDNMMYFGSVFGPAALRRQMVIGEQYECLTTVKKQSDPQNYSEGLMVEIQQVGGTKTGLMFWEFLRRNVKLISSPQPVIVPAAIDANGVVVAAPPAITDQDFELTPDEEFVIVNAKNPAQVLRTASDWGIYSLTHPKDVVVGACKFNPLVGQRKRLKNKATLLGYLNNTSGALHQAVDHYYASNTPLQEKHNLIGVSNLPDWVGANGGSSFTVSSDAKNLELRKYNTVTRKVALVAVNFNIEDYMRRYTQRMMLTTVHGEAVGKVCALMADEGVLYPYLLVADYDVHAPKYKRDETQVPTDKDIFLDVAFKTTKLKKKDMLVVNNNGFVAIACKTEAERDALAAAYSNSEKKARSIGLNDLTNDVRVDLNELGSIFATVSAAPQWTMSARMKRATP